MTRLFLLTNDDGIDAPGLAALANAAAEFGASRWVAPVECHSGCGHRVTTNEPIGVERRGELRWAIAGTPADCVRVGLHHLTTDIDWVLAGLNHGGNLGADVFHSGTIAAVREAALHGKPGIAFSHYRKREMQIDWRRAEGWLRQVLRELLPQPLEPGCFWNVNLPNLEASEPDPRLVYCPLETGPLPVTFREEDTQLHYAGNYHERARQPGRDVDVCFGGAIAITKMSVS